MSDAIWEAYAKSNKKKKKQTKKVSNSYGDVVNRQNEEKQAKGRQEAKRKKESATKTRQDVHKAIQKSNRVSATGSTVKTDYYTTKDNKPKETYKQYQQRLKYAKPVFETAAAINTATNDFASAETLARHDADMQARRQGLGAESSTKLLDEYRKKYSDMFKEYRKTDAGKREIRDLAVSLRQESEQAQNGLPTTLRSEQLTRDEFNAMVTAQTAFGGAQGAKDLGTKYLTQRGKELGTKGDLAEKVGSRTAYSAAKGKFATGVMQGMSYNDILFSGAGKYNEDAQNVIEEVQNSGAYNAGYGVGQTAQFVTSGISGLTKAGLKTGEKQTAKYIAKKLTENTFKKGLKNVGKAAAVETPINALDAVKMSRDETGKANAKDAAMWFGINTLLSGAGEGVAQGLDMVKFAKKAKLLRKLDSDIKAGAADAKTIDQYNTLKKQMSKDVEDFNSISAKTSNRALNDTRGGSKVLADEVNRTRSLKDLSNAIKKSEEAKKKLTGKGFTKEASIVKSLDDNIASLKQAQTNKTIVKDMKKTVRAASDTKVTITKQMEQELYDAAKPISEAIRSGDREAAKKAAKEAAKKYAKEFGTNNKKAKEALAEELYGNAEKYVSKEGIDVKAARNAFDDKEFAKAVDEVFNNGSRMKELKVGDTPEILQKFGASDKSMIIKPNTVPKIAYPENYEAILKGTKKTKGHNLGIGFVKGLRKELEDPVAILKSNTENDSLVVFVNRVDPDGQPVMAAVHIDKQGQISINNEIASVYGRDKYEKFINNQIKKGNLLYEKNKNGLKTLPTEGLQLPNAADVSDPMVNMAHNRETVKAFHKTDAKGVKNLSDPEVQDYLKVAYNERNEMVKKYGRGSKEVKSVEQKIKALEKRAETIQANAEAEALLGVDIKKQATKNEKMLEKAMKTNNATKGVKAKTSTIQRVMVSSMTAAEKVAKAVGGETGERLLNAIDRVYRSEKKAQAWINFRVSTFGNKTSGKALNYIYRDAKKAGVDINDLEEYCLLVHSRDRVKAGKPSIKFDETLGTLDEQIEALEKKYAKKAGANQLVKSQQELVGYTRELLQYEVDTGVTSAASAKKLIEDYPNYVPTRRVLADDKDGFIKIVEDDEVMIKVVDGKHKIYTSSNMEVDSIYKQLVDRTTSTIKQGDLNVLLKEYSDVTNADFKSVMEGVEVEDMLAVPEVKAENGKYVAQVLVNGKHMTVNLDRQMGRGIREWTGKERGAVINSLYKLRVIGSPFKDLITTYNWAFGVRNFVRDTQQAMVNTKNGKYYFKCFPTAAAAAWNKNNAIYKKFAEMGGMMSKASNSRFATSYDDIFTADWYAKPATTAKAAARKVEGFNDLLETQPRLTEFTATIYSDVDKRLAKEPLSKEAFQKEIADDLGMIDFPISDLKIRNVKEMREAVEEIYDIYSSRVERGIVDKPEWINKRGRLSKGDVSDALENAFGEALLRHTGQDTFDTAMRNAMDITLNFSRSGYIGKALNAGLVPYLNPAIQGLSKTTRMFTDDGWKAAISFATKVTLFTGTPAIINEALLGNDEYYQGLPTREKDSNFFIPRGDGMFLKIPKPRENSVLAEPMEYAFRWIFQKTQYGGKDAEWTDFFKNEEGGILQMYNSMIDNIGIVGLGRLSNDSDKSLAGKAADSLISTTIFAPIFHIADNKTWYGGNIESASDIEFRNNGGQSSEIWDESTSAVAKYLANTKWAKWMDKNVFKNQMSPKKIDNFLDSYGGLVYDFGIAATSEKNKALENSPIDLVTRIFTIDALYSNKYGGTEWGKYFEDIEKNGKLSYEQYMNANRLLYDSKQCTVISKALISDNSLSADEKKAAIRDMKRGSFRLLKASFDKGNYNKSFDPVGIVAKHVGIDKALTDYTSSYYDKNGNKVAKQSDAYKEFKKSDGYKTLTKEGKEKAKEAYLECYKNLRLTNKRTGENADDFDWTSLALHVIDSDNKGKDKYTDMVYKDLFDQQVGKGKYKTDMQNGYLNRATNYLSENSVRDYEKSHKIIVKAAKKAGKDYTNELDYPQKSIALGKENQSDSAYYIEGAKVNDRINPSRCLTEKYKWDAQKQYEWADSHKLTVAKCESGDITPNDVKGWIDKDSGCKKREEKAAMFALYFPEEDNPYGEIGDYSHDKDTGLKDESGKGKGSSGKGHRSGHGHHGSYSKGHGGKGVKDNYNEWLKDLYDGSSPYASTKKSSNTMKVSAFNKHDNTRKSVLTEAYRKRKRKEFITSMKGK